MSCDVYIEMLDGLLIPFVYLLNLSTTIICWRRI